ncbi:MAG: hypothetical protein NWF04_07315 [Candidatus Bathyarchaeota archaeon]|nr:hypothetical protein [Candidatus Bathyarchaeota archaeon]
MPITEKFRNFIWGQPLEDLVIDLKMYSKEIARTRDKYKQRASTLYDQAKDCIVKGDDYRAKMYAQQHLSADRTAFSLDMFVINMENLIFDLSNAQSVENIGLSLGKISKSLDKLNLLKTRGVGQVMGKVGQQMEKIGFKTGQIFDQLKDYEPFSVEPTTGKDLDKVMDKMVSEVIAEGPASGLPEAKLSELQQRRQSLKGQSAEDTK